MIIFSVLLDSKLPKTIAYTNKKEIVFMKILTAIDIIKSMVQLIVDFGRSDNLKVICYVIEYPT